MKNAATLPSTNTTTPSRLKMPQFIPAAIGESDWPKHAAQARREFGCRASTTTKPENRVLS
jgi:hypothetical protein